MRQQINWILGGLIALFSGCKTPAKAVQQEVSVLYGVPYATYDISGTVKNEQGESIAGANVIIKGYKHQIIGDTLHTDKQGAFSTIVSDFPTDTLSIITDDPKGKHACDSTTVALPRQGKNSKGFYRGEHVIKTTIQLFKNNK